MEAIKSEIDLTPCLATCAQYFRVGIEAGVCTPDAARDWALFVIASMDEPPGEIIEVSWRKPIAQQIDDLNSVCGEADLELAGKWLLFTLLHSMSSTDKDHWQALTAAKQIAFSTGLSGKNADLYTNLSCLEDALNLAESGTFGNVVACKKELIDVISQYSSPPPDALSN